MNEYLVPANSKKSGLILGLFTWTDIIVLLIGMPISAVALLIVNGGALWKLILAVLPGLISALLVFPVPHYHNVLQLIRNIFSFIMGRKKYEWKGWWMENGK